MLNRARGLLLAFLLFALNALLCRELFAAEYLASMNAAEGRMLSLARWFTTHSLGWLPIWYGGVPAVRAAPFVLPETAANFSLLMHWSVPHSLHFLLALGFCLGPISLYWFLDRVTGWRIFAFVAGLIYSLFGGLRLTLLARDGGGAHILAALLVPLCLFFIHLAVTDRSRWAIALSPLVLGGLTLTDWVAAVGLTMALVAYVLSRLDVIGPKSYLTLIGIVALAYASVCPYMPVSAVRAIAANAHASDRTLLDHSSFIGIVVIIAGLFLLNRIKPSQHMGPWIHFFLYFSWIAGVVVLGREWFGWHLLPQSNLLAVEFQFAACSLFACVAKLVFDRSTLWTRRTFAVLFTAVCVWQVVAIRKMAPVQFHTIDVTQTNEFAFAQWASANLTSERVYAPGNLGAWLNAFSSVEQVTGCCEQDVPNQEYRDAEWVIDTGQNTAAKDAEISMLWLKSLGTGAVAVDGNFSNPHKFDGILPPLWTHGDLVVYGMPAQTASLAHVLPYNQVISYFPEGGLDVDVLRPYVAALDVPASAVEFKWLSDHEARIQANVKTGDRVSVHINHDPGWHAMVGERPAPVYADRLGQMLIDPRCVGNCTIDLRWNGGREAVRTRVWQIAGFVALIVSVLFAGSRFALPALRVSHPRWVLTGLIAAALLLVLVCTAWVAEDAYISFRVTDNFLSGYGLRWNVSERVQTYTDPLFLGLVTAATWISGNVYLSSIVVSIVLTLAAVFLVLQKATRTGLGIALLALFLSKGFLDYSVSGLENPATHLAIAAFLICYWRKRDPLLLSLFAALAVLNREDSLLFFLPALLAVYVREGWKVWKPALLGWTPFLAWLAFSLFYYGFPFPNTAYAKLNTGIPSRDMIRHGLLYCLNAWNWDTVTPLVIVLGLIVAARSKEWMLALGVLLNVLYVVRVGGDYMTGRFLTAAFFMSAGLIAHLWTLRKSQTVAVAAVMVAAGFTIPSPSLLSARSTFGDPWPVESQTQVADQRSYSYQCSGLLRYRTHPPIWEGHLARASNPYWYSCSGPTWFDKSFQVWPDAYLARTGEDLRRKHSGVFIVSTVGMLGYFAGPTVHVLDDMALGDALIARLPMKKNFAWVVGHYQREVPPGYLETVQTGTNKIEDAKLAEYYNHLESVVAGDLWSRQRLKDIVLLNAGYYDRLLPKAR